MHVLLLRPVPGNERFGLGPFFRIEPLGMEYIAAALEAARPHGHARRPALQPLASSTTSPPAGRGSSASPACTRSRPTTCWRWRAACAALARGVPIVVGGHTAAAYPDAVPADHVVAVIVLDDGERAVPRVADALERRRAADGRARARGAGRAGELRRAPPDPGPSVVARRGAAPGAPPRRRAGGGSTPASRIGPTWLIETARGCPFRCSFCSIWQLHARSVARAVDRIGLPGLRRRSAITSSSPTICSGITRRAAWRWRPSCAAAASASTGCSCRAASIWWRGSPELLEAWRPLAREFDIFFGLEAATNDGLTGLSKDATVDQTAQGIEVARERRLRRHRQLRDRSGVGRGTTSSGCGRSSSGTSLFQAGLHDPDAAARHGLLRRDAAAAARAAMGAFRHAPPALGAGARRRAVLRALLRDVAPLGAEPARPEELVALAARGRDPQRVVPASRPFGAARRCSTPGTTWPSTAWRRHRDSRWWPRWRTRTPASEHDANAQLHLPRRRDRRADLAERGERRRLGPGAAERDQRRRPEVDAVEEVEDLDAQLDVAARPRATPTARTS